MYEFSLLPCTPSLLEDSTYWCVGFKLGVLFLQMFVIQLSCYKCDFIFDTFKVVVTVMHIDAVSPSIFILKFLYSVHI